MIAVGYEAECLLAGGVKNGPIVDDDAHLKRGVWAHNHFGIYNLTEWMNKHPGDHDAPDTYRFNTERSLKLRYRKLALPEAEPHPDAWCTKSKEHLDPYKPTTGCCQGCLSYIADFIKKCVS